MPASPFLCIGHRGARGHAPENTLLSIDTGIRLGADMIEFDVQRCEDQLVVIHDPRLERTTTGQGRVEDVRFDYLRSLDAGQGQQVPTLQEVLDLVEARVSLNIEVKSAGGTATRIATVLREALAEGWRPSQFLVSSFHLPELYEFKQAAPEIPVAALVCGVPLDWAGCAVELGAQALNISAEFADTRLLHDAHSRGLKVYVYTVNHPDDMQRLHAAGFDGVFSDYPDRVIANR
ncbi:MAG: glycerophosphodiester phosphodiesterase [Panacagrimonas sp.]|jgi:glycerophosphoryl diester phosphodiesterase|nr:glycerophosphodiester phosphodiesterase family protein [Panacagrimonas sp.]MCC2658842.1 glycerophosphodiester phosphodiesterase [Panacagrimonas sp.]